MEVVDPKVNEAVLKLNKLTQDGRLEWSRIEPLKGIGGEQERFKTTYSDNSFIVKAPDPIALAFIRPTGGSASLAIVDGRERTLYTFPPMPSIDDLFAAIKQRLEERKIHSLLDEFLDLPL